MNYLKVIIMAIFVFPLVSLALILPFLIYHYHKYGSISFFKFLLFFSFAFYLLCAYFLVILPLPKISDVIKYSQPYYNLKPFLLVPEVVMDGNFDIVNPDTYIYLLNSKYVEPFFNILLLIPFGVYLRYYLKCDWWKTLFFSFCLSLFFELTQLTGLYFIYPRPYRLFDVNDLINNTTGGVVGYFLTPLFSFFLPTKDEIDNNDYLRGQKVSVGRRVLALLADYFIVLLIFCVFVVFDFQHLKVIYIVINFVYFVLLYCFSGGYTFGKWMLSFKNIKKDYGQDLSFFQCFFKWFCLHFCLLNGWLVLLIIENRFFNITFVMWGVYIFLFLYFIGHVIFCSLFKKKIFYDRLLDIESISLIGVLDEV